MPAPAALQENEFANLFGRRATRRRFWRVGGERSGVSAGSSCHRHARRGKAPLGSTPYYSLMPPGAEVQARTFPVPNEVGKRSSASWSNTARRRKKAVRAKGTYLDFRGHITVRHLLVPAMLPVAAPPCTATAETPSQLKYRPILRPHAKRASPLTTRSPRTRPTTGPLLLAPRRSRQAGSVASSGDVVWRSISPTMRRAPHGEVSLSGGSRPTRRVPSSCCIGGNDKAKFPIRYDLLRPAFPVHHAVEPLP